MGTDTLVAQLVMAAEWEAMSGPRTGPLTAALRVLGSEGRADARTVSDAIRAQGAATSYAELRAAATRPDTDWSTRVGACLHLLLTDHEVLAVAA